jgi:aminoglycoside phosphotransferase family enzyme/predicted kinase
MDLAAMIDALSQPTAYPVPVRAVRVCQTHISVVFLTDDHAYKIKKPVNLGFLDFSTLEKRRFYCDEEVRLNRRLAPQVYLGVVPVTRTETGLAFEGSGTAVEWAVKMERLPEEATLLERLGHGDIGPDVIESLARKVAAFHAAAERGDHIAGFGRFEVVAGNARENFEQSANQVGTTLSPAVYARLRSATEATLARLRPLIESRAARGVPRDTHGDLHLDHVYLFPEKAPPADLVIVDCIEFNERFRYADPVADMAFLVMDLRFHGWRELAESFAAAYFQASGDAEGRELPPFYTAYRAAVRGKVEGFELMEKEVPEAERSAALVRARAHWLLALGELEEPERRPGLVLVGGLPGAGKSTLARSLAERAYFRVIRTDLVRKELAGMAVQESVTTKFGEGIYTPSWTERTYAECLRRVESALFEGQRVLVDANFGKEAWRRAFLETAARLGVPGLFLHCRADPETTRRRLHGRRGDASDADWYVYQKATERWEAIGPRTRPALREIDTSGTTEQNLARAQEALRAERLLS